MIKNYSILNSKEKKLICKFIARSNGKNISIDEVDNIFRKKIYDYGKGAIFYFHKEKVVAKIGIVLEVVKELGTVYIHDLDVIEDLEDNASMIKKLINNAISIGNIYGASEILLGERNLEKLKVLESIGYSKTYSAINMYLEKQEKRNSCLELVLLTSDNKLEYLNVFNDSFSDMPHGTFAYIEDIDGYISSSDGFNYYFLVKNEKENIGFLNCRIIGKEGSFDIGLCKKYRGRGFGKQLLETAIDFLDKKEVLKVKLIVIERNTIAYNMYKKRGFKEESILSHWIKIK